MGIMMFLLLNLTILVCYSKIMNLSVGSQRSFMFLKVLYSRVFIHIFTQISFYLFVHYVTTKIENILNKYKYKYTHCYEYKYTHCS